MFNKESCSKIGAASLISLGVLGTDEHEIQNDLMINEEELEEEKE